MPAFLVVFTPQLLVSLLLWCFDWKRLSKNILLLEVDIDHSSVPVVPGIISVVLKNEQPSEPSSAMVQAGQGWLSSFCCYSLLFVSRS